MTILARARVVLEGDTARLIASFAAAESALQQSGRRMEEIGRDLTTKITLPLAGIGGAAIHAASDFDHSLRKTAALTALTEEQTYGLADSVRELGMQYGASGKQAADALLFVATPSLTLAETMDVVRESLKGMAVGLGEANVVALGAVGAMNAYEKQGLSAARAVEILTAGVKFGRFEASELVPVLGRLTGIASAMGIAFEDVVGVLSVLTLTGSNTFEASTQLSAIMSTLMGTSEEGEKILQGFGLSLESLRKTAAQPGGLIEVFRALDTATQGNIEQLEAVFPNIRALRGVMNALAQDAGLVDRAMRGVRNSTGVLDKSFAVFAAAPAFQMRQALANVKDALIELGQVITPVVVPMLRALGEAVRNAALWFSSLSPFVQKFVMVTAGLAMTVGPVVFLLGALLKVLSAFKFSILITGVASLGAAFGKLFAAVKGFVFFSGIQSAFAAAAIAGTGLKGVLIGLVPAFRMLWAAVAPWLAGATIVVGLGAVAYKWFEMRTEVAKVEKAIKDAASEMDKMFTAVNPETAAAKVAQFDKRIADLTAEMNNYLSRAREAGRAQTFAAEATRTGATPAIKENQTALMNSAVEIQATIETLRRHRNILAEVARVYGTVTQQGNTTTNTVQKQAAWVQPATEAMKALAAQLKNAATMQQLFGAEFDINEAHAKALTEAIESLVAAGTPLDTAIGNTGVTLRQLAEQLKTVQADIDNAKTAQDELNATYSRAQAAVESALSPQQVYERGLMDVHTALVMGKISAVEFEAAVKKLQETLDAAVSKTGGLSVAMNQAMHDIASRAVESFVDFSLDNQPVKEYKKALQELDAELAAGKINWDQYQSGIARARDTFEEAKMTLGKFVRQMLLDLTKLIIKVEILRLLFPESKGGKFLGGILGFADGGFLPAGEVGLVGEQGPELVTAGRGGMTITPMPGGSADRVALGGGDAVSVNLTVNAIDSRDTARFFEENEGMLSGLMLRAFQRSTMLKRRFGGS